MPVNRNALIRYKTIDLCLQNRYRKWTLDDLIEACSDTLYEYEGIKKGVGRRTIQLDIQLMRSDKLGYNAPIVVSERKYYTYEDPDYSIMNIPLSESDLNKLMETVDFLKQFKGFSHFKELDTMVQKLEDHIYSKKINRNPVIDFEKNDNLKGLEFLETLYQAIIHKNILEITYQSFHARQPTTFLFYPYLLKEYRNRWFLIGLKNNVKPILNLAIDRIVDVRNCERLFSVKDDFDAEAYFRDVIGVTVEQGTAPEKVMLFINRKVAPYIITKPLHPSQKVVGKEEYGVTISLDVQHNFELEKEILAFGDGILVISPEKLRSNIVDRLKNAVDLYKTTVTAKSANAIRRKYEWKGFGIISKLYPQRSLFQLSHKISKLKGLANGNDVGFAIDLTADNIAKPILINSSLEKVLNPIAKNYEMRTAKYYEAVPETFFDYKQSNDFNQLTIIVLLSELKSKSFLMQIVPGSHNKQLSDEKVALIVGNCIPVDCQLNVGSAILLHPMVIKRFAPSLRDERVRFVVIDFVLKHLLQT